MKRIGLMLFIGVVAAQARLMETEQEMEARYEPGKGAASQTEAALEMKKKLDAEKAKRKLPGGGTAVKRMGTAPPPTAPVVKSTEPKFRMFQTEGMRVDAWFCQTAQPTYGGMSAEGRVIVEKLILLSPSEKLSQSDLINILKVNQGTSEWENMEAVVEACLKDPRPREQWFTAPTTVRTQVPTESGVREVPVQIYNFADSYKLKTKDGTRGAIITPVGVHLWMTPDTALPKERTLKY
ncbi:MAG: hypothetical protein N3B01_05600 [Verrucomicrobiae bacterium]|nr:hypothetical protein [Verrucomicrobiae bacterium]